MIQTPIATRLTQFLLRDGSAPIIGSVDNSISTLIIMLIAGHVASVHLHQQQGTCYLLKFVIAQLLLPCAEKHSPSRSSCDAQPTTLNVSQPISIGEHCVHRAMTHSNDKSTTKAVRVSVLSVFAALLLTE